MNLLDAQILIDKEMLDHGLFANGWVFGWSNAKTICGQCLIYSKVITMSRHYATLNPEAEVRDTILHEIAHALVGPGHHHDRVWKRMAIAVGAKPIPCVDAQSVVMPKGSYVGTCPGCNAEFQRYRRPSPTGVYEHTPCKRMGRPSSVVWRKV